jgi:predicted ArsR family transcriptional regulator
LKAENASLKSELKALKGPGGGLPQDAEKILEFIARNENATAPQIARALGINKGVTDMHLDDLATANHVDASFVMGQEPEYYLAQSGRRYLHGKGLL